MTAETSLDEQIAEQLWGWADTCNHMLDISGIRDVPRANAPYTCTKCGTPAFYGTTHRNGLRPPPFSTDIAEAFRVVGEMAWRGWYLASLDGWTNNPGWLAEFERDPMEHTRPALSRGKTPAEAICKAALRTLERARERAEEPA